MLKKAEKTNIIGCPHSSRVEIVWIENVPGKPPTFAYRRLPEEGLIQLSNKTVRVLCAQCSQKEHWFIDTSAWTLIDPDGSLKA